MDRSGIVHPLAAVLAAAAEGSFPPADGEVEVLPPDSDGSRAIVAFTGHAYVLGDLDADAVAGGGFGGVNDPAVQLQLAGPDAGCGSLDVVLVARGGQNGAEAGTMSGAVELAPDDPRVSHARVERALLHRRNVRVLANDFGLVVIGSGLVGRTELSVELTHLNSPPGTGRALLAAGLAAVGDGWCWAQVAAGNARSLRAFLAAGFVPVCSEVLISPPGGWVGSS